MQLKLTMAAVSQIRLDCGGMTCRLFDPHWSRDDGSRVKKTMILPINPPHMSVSLSGPGTWKGLERRREWRERVVVLCSHLIKEQSDRRRLREERVCEFERSLEGRCCLCSTAEYQWKQFFSGKENNISSSNSVCVLHLISNTNVKNLSWD